MAIKLLKRLFSQLANPSVLKTEAPQNRVYNEPPVPVGEWGMIVDKNGDAVMGRKPDGYDFIARYPVEYSYGGTIPKPNVAEYSDRAVRAGALAEYAERDNRNRMLLDKAVFLLSQTDDGRRLLRVAKDQKFSFAFDKERTEKEGAAGLCDYANKLVPLAEGATAEQVALTLKHELQHMEDIGKGISYNNTHSLRSSVMADRCLESNARVSEAVTCVELLKGNDRGPERQFRTSALFACFFDKNRPMAERALRNMDKIEKSDWNGFAAQVFDGYYSQNDTLDYYDKRQADMYAERLTSSPEEVFDNNDPRYAEWRRHFSNKDNLVKYGQQKLNGIAEHDHWTHHQDSLKDKITVKGYQSYLTGADSPDLNDKKYCHFSSESLKKIAVFIEKAKQFIPNKIEALASAMDIPARHHNTQLSVMPSPFMGHHNTSSSEFQAISLPDRYDDVGYRANIGYETVSKKFKELYDKGVNYPEKLDKISLAIELMAHEYRHGCNIRGVMGDLVDAGLRVPVAALPEEYILELSRNLRYGADKGDMSGLSKADLTLMQHWRDMAHNGIDPVYGNEVTNKAYTLFHEHENAHYKHYIKPYIDVIVKEMPASKPNLTRAQSGLKQAERA